MLSDKAMKKIFVLTIIIGLLLTTSTSCINASYSKIQSNMLLYEYFTDQSAESMHIQAVTISNDYTNMSLLWKNSDDVGLSYHNPVFSGDVNGDGILEVLANHSALNGRTGKLIWHTSTGQICGVGDINCDGKDEVFTSTSGWETSDYSYLYCLDGSTGAILWEDCLNCILIYDISVGNISGDTKNEVIVPTGDWLPRNNQYVYCLNGGTGEIIWKTFTKGWANAAKIADVNNDGNNETMVFSDDWRLHCLDEYGNYLWDILAPAHRVMCFGELNQDPYKEIILEYSYGICCVSGYNGSTLWTWLPEPDAGCTGSVQSMIIADMIIGIPGNEVIMGGIGLYCLRGGDNVNPDERQIWHAGISNGYLPGIVMSSDVGDLDNDGFLDVAAITAPASPCSEPKVYVIDGQLGTSLWKYDDCGTENFHAIIIADVNGDNLLDIIAKDDYFVCVLTNNISPNEPSIDGPILGKPGISYIYKISSIDPEGDNVFYLIDWGDNTSSGWFGPYVSGEMKTVSHTWLQKGTYIVKAKAKDVYGAESDWAILSVTMPKNDEVSQSSQSGSQSQSIPIPSNQAGSTPTQQSTSTGTTTSSTSTSSATTTTTTSTTTNSS